MRRAAGLCWMEGGHLEGVVKHEDDFVVVVVDGHLQVQAVKLAQVSADGRVRREAGRSRAGQRGT